MERRVNLSTKLLIHEKESIYRFSSEVVHRLSNGYKLQSDCVAGSLKGNYNSCTFRSLGSVLSRTNTSRIHRHRLPGCAANFLVCTNLHATKLGVVVGWQKVIDGHINSMRMRRSLVGKQQETRTTTTPRTSECDDFLAK